MLEDVLSGFLFMTSVIYSKFSKVPNTKCHQLAWLVSTVS